jgi:mutator protein MutT
MIEIYETAPEGFSTCVQASACYLVCEGKILLLHRAADRVEPGAWGVPAGKLESGETPEEAVVRELQEETGIVTTAKLQYIGTCYIRKSEIDFVYHRFRIDLDYIPEVRLSEEHIAYTWATAADIETLPLMLGERELLYSF